MADIAFVPQKLIEAGQRISERHLLPEEYAGMDHTEETRALLDRLYGISDDMDRAAAVSLSEKEVLLLSDYVPRNDLELDIGKLCGILRNCLDERSGETLFFGWQEYFYHADLNRFIQTLVVSNREFQDVLHRHHIPERVFLTVLENPHIPLCFDEELIGREFVSAEDFNEKLQYYGVVEESYLDMECKRALMTFCGKTDYFSCSEENILDIIRTYDTFMLRRFLLNFIGKMSLAELQVYPQLAEYLWQIIGPRKSETFAEFFRDVPSDQVQQYLDWINLYRIDFYFENDERSRFWKRYRYVNVLRYPVSNVVILEFEQYIAVEFLGPKKGTIYLCEKTVFRDMFYDKLDTMSNEDLRIYFKIHRDACLEYRNHSVRWQAHMDSVIAKRGIAEKVEL